MKLIIGLLMIISLGFITTPVLAKQTTSNFDVKKPLLDRLKCVTAGPDDYVCSGDFSKSTTRDGVCEKGKPIPAAGNCTVCDALYIGVLGIQYLFGLLGFVAILIFSVSGFQMVMAQGNSSEFIAGLNGLKGAILGIVIILGSWQIVNLLTAAITSNVAVQKGKRVQIYINNLPQAWYNYCDSKVNIQKN